MGVEFYIAQGVSVLTAIVAVLMVQFKNVKMILLGQLVANLLTAITYILLGGLSGGGICLIAILQSLVVFGYTQKKKRMHGWVLALFIMAYVACSMAYYKTVLDIFPALAAVFFAVSITMERSFLARVWYIFSPIFWVVYDIATLAYGNLLIHAVVFTSTMIALIRIDDIFGWKKRKKTVNAVVDEENE